jgi:CIC family chloride channel protein
VRFRDGSLDRRVSRISLLAVGVAFAAGFIAQWLMRLITLITNIAFFHRVTFAAVSPSQNHLGVSVIVVPAIGGVIVGLMARYGSKAIRGHGIPEAMEQVLLNQSRIPARMTFLKPISAAIAIGTGGPFGAEGPIIATGGALGSLVGQIVRTTADERKTLLAAGAAAGMAATFGSPVSAVLLAVELLLFEYRARSLIPVALAAVTATGVRFAYAGAGPVFPMPTVAPPTGHALIFYVALGAVMGLAAVFVTRVLYWVEDGFEKLPIHWMWWPALGGLVVGAVGYFAPHTLGVGYDNIQGIVSGSISGRALMFLCIAKFVSWSVSLGSGTSGGTLAPIFTIGGALGAALGTLAVMIAPQLGVDPRIAALVGMAALFAGASRALLASAVFAFETTEQPMGLLPLLGGCTAAYLVSLALMKNSIMTEKIERRGVRVPAEYAADLFERVMVREVGLKDVVSLGAAQSLRAVRDWLNSRMTGTLHQGYPVMDGPRVIGVLTRRDIFDTRESDDRILRDLVKRRPVLISASTNLRIAADTMVRESVGRLLVVSEDDPEKLIGLVTRSDLLAAHRRRLADAMLENPLYVLKALRLGFPRGRGSLRSRSSPPAA